MPGFQGHMAGALCSWGLLVICVLTWYTATGFEVAEWALAAIFGGMFPDLDIKSIGQKWFYRLLFGVGLWLLFYQQYQLLAFVLMTALFPLLVKHRGVMHAWWFVTGVTLVLVTGIPLLYPAVKTALMLDALFFWVGAMSHLFLDFYGIRQAQRWLYRGLAGVCVWLFCAKCYSWSTMRKPTAMEHISAHVSSWVKAFSKRR